MEDRRIGLTVILILKYILTQNAVLGSGRRALNKAALRGILHVQNLILQLAFYIFKLNYFFYKCLVLLFNYIEFIMLLFCLRRKMLILLVDLNFEVVLKFLAF